MFKLNTRQKYIVNSKGQTLVFVIVAMTIALALGISVSVRTISSLSRTSRTDTFVRVQAAAEGGAERFLLLPNGVLSEGVSQDECEGLDLTYSNGECIVTFPPVDVADKISSRARVLVSEFSTNTDNDTYKMNIEKDTTSEVNVDGITEVKICWQPPEVATSPITGFYYILYSASDDMDEAIVLNKGGVIQTDNGDYKGFSTPDSQTENPSTYCKEDIDVTGASALRIRSIGENLSIEVSSTGSGDMPLQGYLIESTGELLQEGGVAVSKKVSVYKSYPFLPGVFDFSLYSGVGWK
ncbi:MAG: hypothetical protein ACD_22C00018G0005 [uncultured bacterium]|nr:MAG: hypothetical protein ACD_22C00018G0005 [uncultured bacterium]